MTNDTTESRKRLIATALLALSVAGSIFAQTEPLAPSELAAGTDGITRNSGGLRRGTPGSGDATTAVWGSTTTLSPSALAKVSKELSGQLPASIGVIVRYKAMPGDKHHQKVVDGGGQVQNKFDFIRSAHYSVPASMLKQLAEDPEVEFVSPDRPVRGMLDLTTAAVNAGAAASYGLDGTGVGIAIIDSGISSIVYDFRNATQTTARVVYSQDFTGLGAGVDSYGHGTHVAGIAAGNGTNSNGQSYTRTFKGVAPNANIIDLRVLDSTGAGTDSRVIAAINQAILLKSRYNIRVINLSLGRAVSESYATDPLCQAVEAAWKAGIVVVVAAGNQGRNNNGGINGYGTITAPGNDPHVITVGAMKSMNTPGRTDDRIASYSSKGPTLYDHIVKPDLVAPGNQVISSVLYYQSGLYSAYPSTQILCSVYVAYRGDSNCENHAQYYYALSGTSMATPVVSGAAALLLQQNPSLTPDQVKARLMKTAYKSFPTASIATDLSTGLTYTSYYDIFTVGAGYLDIGAALASTAVLTLGEN